MKYCLYGNFTVKIQASLGGGGGSRGSAKLQTQARLVYMYTCIQSHKPLSRLKYLVEVLLRTCVYIPNNIGKLHTPTALFPVRGDPGN